MPDGIEDSSDGSAWVGINTWQSVVLVLGPTSEKKKTKQSKTQQAHGDTA